MVMGSSGVTRGPVGAASGWAVVANGVAGAGSFLLLAILSPSETGEDGREGVAFAQPALRISRDRMTVRRDEESLRPSVMLFKLEDVLKMWHMGPELAAELDGHLATRILVTSGEPESVFRSSEKC